MEASNPTYVSEPCDRLLILHIVNVMRGQPILSIGRETRFILPFPDLNLNPSDVGKEVVPPDGNYIILVAY